MIKLTDVQKAKLKKYSLYTSGIILIIVLILLLFRCGGCSGISGRAKHSDSVFDDGNGHKYSSEGGYYYYDENGELKFRELLPGQSLSEEELKLIEKAAEDELRRAEEEKKAEEEKTAEEKKRKAEAAEKAEKNRLEAEEKERLEKQKEIEKARLEEEKLALEKKNKEQEEKKLTDDKKKKADEEKKLAEEKKRKAEESKKKAAEEKKLKEEEAKKKAAEEKRLKEEARKKAEEEKRLAEEKKKQEEEKRLKEEAEKKAAEEKLTKEKEERSKVQLDKDSSLEDKLNKIAEDYGTGAAETNKDSLLNEGLELANEILKKDSKNSAAHYMLAQDAMKKKNYDLASIEMQKAIENAMNNYLYYYDLGKLQYMQRKYKDAAQSFNTSCELNDKFEPSRYNLGLTYVKLQNESLALDSFEKSVKINPKYEKGYIEQARVYNRIDDFQNAVKLYKQVMDINPQNISAIMELGSVYYQHGELELSEQQYKLALSKLNKSEDQTLTKYNLSTVLYDEGKLSEAQKYAWQAYDEKDFLKNDKLKVNIVYNYALIMDRSKKYQDAKMLYLEVIEMNPEHVKAKINLSVIYMSEENPDLDSVIEMLTEAGKIEQENFEVNNNLGSAYLLRKDYDKAINCFIEALNIIPEDTDALSNLANAYAKNQEYDNARVTFEKLLKIDSKNWAAYISLAKVYIQLELTAEAQDRLLYVKKNNPDYRKAEVDSLLAVLLN